MRILVYFPYNQRTVEQQSVMEMFVKQGHKVFLLTLAPFGNLHSIVNAMGVTAYASPYKGTSKSDILKNAFYVYQFCRKHKIDIVFAHQQLCALPLIIVKLFIKAAIFYIRHNSDEDYINNPLKAKILNKFINSLLPNIIAPSQKVYDFLNKTEKVNSKKLIRINYGYNFRQYEPANEEKVSEIRNKFNCTLLVVSIARLTAPKRHILMFEAIKNCIDFGLDIKFVCLGSGPLNVELVKWINENNLDKNIFLEGVQLKIFDYLKAADILLHLSATEASNSVVKEAALALKPVIVCAGVGDFSDYVTDKENSFLVNKDNPVAETVEILKTYYNKAGALQKIGEKFNQTVLTQFDIKNVESSYNQLLKQH